MPELGQPFDFSHGLPEGLVLAKPVEQGSYDPAVIAEYEKKWPIMATRKWNGHRILVSVTKNGGTAAEPAIRLYSDGKHRRVDLHLAHAVNELRSLGVPPGTLLTAEAIMERDGVDQLGAVASILQMGDGDEAQARQSREGRAKLILHGALCWNNRWLNGTPYDEVLMNLTGLAPHGGGTWVKPVRLETDPLAESQQRVRDRGWEGLVLNRHDYLTTWRLDGPDASNPRPDGSYKWKPQQDGDFIADELRMSEKRPGRIKDVMLFQLDPATGKKFRCGRLGNFSAETDELLKKGLGRRGKTVLEVRFDGRTPKGKLVSPRFVRIRTDKRATQCVAEKSYAEAEFVK